MWIDNYGNKRKHYTYPCIDCGKQLVFRYKHNSPNKLLCEDCKIKRKTTTICQLCGRKFEVVEPRFKDKTKFCDTCKVIYRSDNSRDIIEGIRIAYERLVRINPAKAQKFANEMEVLEGKEFKDKVLGGLTPY